MTTREGEHPVSIVWNTDGALCPFFGMNIFRAVLGGGAESSF